MRKPLAGQEDTIRNSADTAALEHALDQWAVAWSSGDVQKLLILFTDDVAYEDVMFGAVNTGKEALRNFATAALEPSLA